LSFSKTPAYPVHSLTLVFNALEKEGPTTNNITNNSQLETQLGTVKKNSLLEKNTEMVFDHLRFDERTRKFYWLILSD
jgi:hypothetical protein